MIEIEKIYRSRLKSYSAKVAFLNDIFRCIYYIVRDVSFAIWSDFQLVSVLLAADALVLLFSTISRLSSPDNDKSAAVWFVYPALLSISTVRWSIYSVTSSSYHFSGCNGGDSYFLSNAWSNHFGCFVYFLATSHCMRLAGVFLVASKCEQF